MQEGRAGSEDFFVSFSNDSTSVSLRDQDSLGTGASREVLMIDVCNRTDKKEKGLRPGSNTY